MSLKDEVKRQYQNKLKKAIAANSKEEIEQCEQILRQFADYDIQHNGNGIFPLDLLKSLKTSILERWKANSYPETALITMFLYGSWLRGTHTDNSHLNIGIVYVRFDSKGKRILKDSGFSENEVVKIEDIKTKFDQNPISIDFQGKKRDVELYFKEITSPVIEDYHAGPKIYL